MFMRPISQTNFWWHLRQQTAICQSNVFTVFWWEIYLSVKPISGDIYGGRLQSINQMHLQYFGGKYTFCQSDTETTFMVAKCSNDSWEILERAETT